MSNENSHDEPKWYKILSGIYLLGMFLSMLFLLFLLISWALDKEFLT